MEVNNHELKEVSYLKLSEAWLPKLQERSLYLIGH